MTRVAFAIPGDLALPTGGYAYDRHVLRLLPGCGVEVEHIALPGGYPSPTAADLEETRRLVSATSRSDVLFIDGLAYGAMPAGLVRRFDRRIVAMVHHPLCLETGVPPARAAELKRLETEALALARAVVVSSATTGHTLTSDFGVSPAKLTVAEPGTTPQTRARGSGSGPLRLLAVGSVVPRKGYDVLVEAMQPLKVLDWQLDIAGALDRSPDTVRELVKQIAGLGLQDRVRLLGPVDDTRLSELYDQCDLFVMSSHYEGYGMVLTEALSRGLAIVTTTGGAAEQTVPDGAALKVEPGSPRALAWTLGRAIEDRKIRQSLSDAAWEAASRLPRWEDTARTIAGVIEEVGR